MCRPVPRPTVPHLRPSASAGPPRRIRVPGVEPLEGRQLLSFFYPLGNKFARVHSGGVLDVISVSGPGQVFTKRINRNAIAISLYGTTQDSTVTISSLGAHPDKNHPLQIGMIRVHTGRLGSFQGLTTADLEGRLSPLIGPINSLQFDSLGSAARIDINGNLTQLTVNRRVDLGPTGHITVDGNLSSFSIGSNLQTSGGGQVHVLGDLGVLSVTGIVQGKGSEDVVVGDDLGQLTVLGGGNDVFSLQGVDVDVTKNIQGLDVRDGITGSMITAGILIDGGTLGAGANGWNIGPDGALAVFDSQIRAGFEIRNITIGGDVKSDLPGNPSSGRVTRIVAGEDRDGNFSAGGIIDNLQIVGQLIDSVLAASVQPYFGTGAEPQTPSSPYDTPPPLPTSPSNDGGSKTYDKPAGTITAGFVGGKQNQTIATYAAPPYAASDPMSDPTIDDLVLRGGAINPSFAPALQVVPPDASSGTKLPLPSKSTVLGGVVSTSHGDNADFAGIFAANTNGVFVGLLPTS